MVFACSVCNVSLNSQSQLSQHQAGSKHLKKLKAAGGLVSVAAGKTKLNSTRLVVAARKSNSTWPD